MKKCNFLKLSMLALISHGQLPGAVPPPPPPGRIPTMEEIIQLNTKAAAQKAGWAGRAGQNSQATSASTKKLPVPAKQLGVSLKDIQSIKLKKTGNLPTTQTAPQQPMRSSMESALGKMADKNPGILDSKKVAPTVAPKPNQKKQAPQPAQKPSITPRAPEKQSVELTDSQKRIAKLVSDIRALDISILTTKNLSARRKMMGMDDESESSDDLTILRLKRELQEKKELLAHELSPVKNPYNMDFLRDETGEIDLVKAELFFSLNKQLIARILHAYNNPWQEVAAEDDEWYEVTVPETDCCMIDRDTLGEELDQQAVAQEVDLGLESTDMVANEFIEAVKESLFRQALEEYSTKHDLNLLAFDNDWYLSE